MTNHTLCHRITSPASGGFRGPTLPQLHAHNPTTHAKIPHCRRKNALPRPAPGEGERESEKAQNEPIFPPVRV